MNTYFISHQFHVKDEEEPFILEMIVYDLLRHRHILHEMLDRGWKIKEERNKNDPNMFSIEISDVGSEAEYIKFVSEVVDVEVPYVLAMNQGEDKLIQAAMRAYGEMEQVREMRGNS